MTKCTCPKCNPPQEACNRLYKRDMASSERLRFSDPKYWCQCGAWKYIDASCCEDCWKEQEAYIDR